MRIGIVGWATMATIGWATMATSTPHLVSSVKSFVKMDLAAINIIGPKMGFCGTLGAAVVANCCCRPFNWDSAGYCGILGAAVVANCCCHPFN